MNILIVDKSGNPKNWSTIETAVCYYANDKVVWEIGERVAKLRGGINAKTAQRSLIEISSVLGIHGPIVTDKIFENKIHCNIVNRQILYSRDKNICAYCGYKFDPKKLTIDHILPKSRGGENTWENCVTSCCFCNRKKDNRTPEEAHMQLIYVPYAPSRYEKMILRNRKILKDQMEFLLARVPKNSRLFS